MFRVQYLTQKIVLDRLVTRRQHYLAIEIAKYLKMPEKDGSSRILVQWAKYKVRIDICEIKSCENSAKRKPV